MNFALEGGDESPHSTSEHSPRNMSIEGESCLALESGVVPPHSHARVRKSF